MPINNLFLHPMRLLLSSWLLLIQLSLHHNGSGIYVRAQSENYCRGKKDRDNHMYSYWQTNFPYSVVDEQPKALCDGVVTVDNNNKNNGQICISGRANFNQMADALKTQNFFQGGARTVSVNGCLIGGSCNVNFGARARFLYDFLTSYVVNGKRYSASDSAKLVDNLIAASRGTIDEICFASELRQLEQWYEIYYEMGADTSTLADLSQPVGNVFCGYFNCAIEFHKELDEKPDDPLTKWLSAIRFYGATISLGLTPDWIYQYIPFFATTSLIRSVTLPGFYSTTMFPHPFRAPDRLGGGEVVQIDVHWEYFVKAVADGLFTRNRPPLFFNVVTQRVLATGTNYKCWNREGDSDDSRYIALIGIEAPRGFAEQQDRFIDTVVYPALKKYTDDISIHFGKRNPPNSRILQSALDFYKKCGAQIALGTVVPCYHPTCDRTNKPRDFTYPPKYYAPADWQAPNRTGVTIIVETTPENDNASGNVTR